MWCPMLQAPWKVVDIATRSLHLPPCSEHTCQLPGCNITLTAGSVMTVKGRYHGAGGKWNGPTPKWARLQYRMLYTRVSHAAFRTSAGKTNWASLSCGRWHPSNYQRSHFFSVIRFGFFLPLPLGKYKTAEMTSRAAVLVGIANSKGHPWWMQTPPLEQFANCKVLFYCQCLTSYDWPELTVLWREVCWEDSFRSRKTNGADNHKSQPCFNQKSFITTEMMRTKFCNVNVVTPQCLNSSMWYHCGSRNRNDKCTITRILVKS